MRRVVSNFDTATDSAFLAILAYLYIRCVLCERGANLVVSWADMLNLTTMCATRVKGTVLSHGCCLITQIRCNAGRLDCIPGCLIDLEGLVRDEMGHE